MLAGRAALAGLELERPRPLDQRPVCRDRAGGRRHGRGAHRLRRCDDRLRGARAAAQPAASRLAGHARVRSAHPVDLPPRRPAHPLRATGLPPRRPRLHGTSQLANAGGQLDSTLGTTGVVLLLVGGCFAATAMLRSLEWKLLATTVFALRAAVIVVIMLLAVVPAAHGGAVERLLALAGAALLGVTATRTLRLQRAGGEGRSTPGRNRPAAPG